MKISFKGRIINSSRIAYTEFNSENDIAYIVFDNDISIEIDCSEKEYNTLVTDIADLVI